VVLHELRALIEANPELAPEPHPLEQVGASSVLHAPIRHSWPMLSLEKATKPEQVAAFFGRFLGQPVAVMPKLDGLSLTAIYEDDKLPPGVTRGDGTTDDDVTYLVEALIDGVPDRIDAPAGWRCAARRVSGVLLEWLDASHAQAAPAAPAVPAASGGRL
jgi:DNA ligase (NAD+)